MSSRWRGPFRHRNYRLFWFGQLVSLAGTWMQSIAQAWLITELSSNPIWLGVVAAAQFSPVLFLGLFGGVVADVLPKRPTLIGVQATLMGLAALQALLVAFGVVSIPVLIVLAVALGCVNSIDMPVRQSFISEMIPEDEVGRAVALNSAMFNAARVVGPAIGGILIGVIGIAGCFGVNALSFLAVLIALLSMRVGELRSAPRSDRPRSVADVAASLREGIRYVVRTPAAALAVFTIGIVSGVAMNFNVVIPALARGVLNVGAPGLGALMAAAGAGSLAGALSVATLKRPRVRLIVLGAAGLGVLSVVAGLVSKSGTSGATLATSIALFGAGFGAIVMAASANATIQTAAPPHLRGRVMSVYTTVFAGTTPIGALATGAAIALFGASDALVLAGGLALCAATYAGVRWRALMLEPTTSEAAQLP
jgi:MFS family permease